LEDARARDRKGGCRRGMSKEVEQKAMLAKTYYREEKMSVNQITKEIGVPKMTFYNISNTGMFPSEIILYLIK